MGSHIVSYGRKIRKENINHSIAPSMGLFVYTGKTSYYLYEKSIKILNITMIIITIIIYNVT